MNKCKRIKKKQEGKERESKRRGWIRKLRDGKKRMSLMKRRE